MFNKIKIDLKILFETESSINGTSDAHYYSLQNETISDTLLDKFSNMTTTQNHLNDRIIMRITIVKDANAQNQYQYHPMNSCERQNVTGKQDNSMTLGISVVQGSDNNVYVKDLMKNAPGQRHGVLIGDQVSCLFLIASFINQFVINLARSFLDISGKWYISIEYVI